MTCVFGYYSDKGVFKDSTGKTRKVNYIAEGRRLRRRPGRSRSSTSSSTPRRSFAIWTLGSPATLKTYDKINQRCVPQPCRMTGHPAWGDPVNHPWTTGAPMLTYSTEALLWGAFIEQHLDEFPAGKIKVAALVMNNDFGKLYDSAFKAVPSPQSPH